jgi:hypothetical protein
MVEVPQLGDQNEVLAAGKDLVDRCELASEADRLADVGGLRGDVEPVHDGAAGVRLEQRREILRGGLATRWLASEMLPAMSRSAAHLEVPTIRSGDRMMMV